MRDLRLVVHYDLERGGFQNSGMQFPTVIYKVGRDRDKALRIAAPPTIKRGGDEPVRQLCKRF